MIVTFLTRIHNCSKIDKMKNGEYYLILLQSKASLLILKNYWWSWSLLVFVYKKKGKCKKTMVKKAETLLYYCWFFFSKWSRFKTSDRTRQFEKEIVIRGNTYTPSSNRMMPITLKIPARGLSKTMTTHIQEMTHL